MTAPTGLTHDELKAKAAQYLLRTPGYLNQPVLVRGLGTRVWDVDGREYLDFNSGQMCATLGHSHPRLVEAIKRSADTFIHSSSTQLNDISILLAEKLAGLLPEPLKMSLFLSTGSEANEVAMSIAKIYTGGFEIASFHTSYHGRTAGVRTVNRALDHAGYGPMLPGSHTLWGPYAYRCPLCRKAGECTRDCLEMSFEMFDRAVVGQQAAVMVEPVFNAGGAMEFPAGFLRRVRDKCRERGMLFIMDEEATALGRLGCMFAFEQEDVVPDIITLGKTLGAGIPVSSLTTSREIWERVRSRGFFHSSTHAYDPLPLVVAYTVLEVVQEEKLPQQVAERGAYLKGRLEKLAEEHELIGQVRGRGFLQAVELVRNRETLEPAAKETEAVVRECMRRGMIIAQTGMAGLKNCIKFAPPFVASREEIDQAVEIFSQSLKTVETSSRA